MASLPGSPPTKGQLAAFATGIIWYSFPNYSQSKQSGNTMDKSVTGIGMLAQFAVHGI